MAYSGFYGPKLSELVPTLTGAENWTDWNYSLRWVLDARNTRFYEVLIGKFKKPEATITPATADSPEVIIPPDAGLLKEWEMASRTLMPWINATTHKNLKCYINSADNAHTAFQSLYRAFAPSLLSTGLVKFTMYTSLKYTAGQDDPQEFINSFRASLEEATQACGAFPAKHIYYQLLFAISHSKCTHQWLSSLRPDFSASSESILEETYADFVVSERCRLSPCGYPQLGVDGPVLGKRFWRYCEFHHRKVRHAPEECSLNPQNADASPHATDEARIKTEPYLSAPSAWIYC